MNINIRSLTLPLLVLALLQPVTAGTLLVNSQEADRTLAFGDTFSWLNGGYLGVTTDGSGNIYVADFAGKVLKYSRTGVFQSEFASFDDIWDSFNGIGFGPDGTFYGASAITGDMYKFDPTGGVATTVLIPAPTVGDAYGFAVRSTGDLYVARFSSGEFQRYDSDGNLLGSFGQGILSGPMAPAFGPNGYLYVADFRSGHVHWFDAGSGAHLGTLDAKPGQPLTSPTGLAFGPSGALYVATVESDQILEYNYLSGQFVGVFASVQDPTYMVYLSDVSDVPEPGSLALTAGALIFGLFRLRRSRS